jgi:hypothetical protein
MYDELRKNRGERVDSREESHSRSTQGWMMGIVRALKLSAENGVNSQKVCYSGFRERRTSTEGVEGLSDALSYGCWQI